MQVRDLGLISWRNALDIQMLRVDEVAAGTAPPALFLLEHEPVITLGRSGKRDSLHVSEQELERRGIALEHARRGGDVTCHFPGQLVAYVVLHAGNRPGGLKQLFFDLEQAVIDLLEEFQIPATREEGRPGVWVQGRKIASIGLGVRRWVTFHGLALNVKQDLALFELLTPCGLAGVTPTSMERERAAAGVEPWLVAMQEVKNAFVQRFRETFAAA